MFERFTDAARGVVVYAQEEARLLDHDYIGTEHILLGMLRDESDKAAQVLVESGAGLDATREAVVKVVGRGDAAPTGHIPFTPRAKKVLELSLREALQLGHNYIGTEHILLGLMREGEGGGAKVLQSSGLDFAALREQIIALLRAGQQPPPMSPYAGAARGLPAVESRLEAIEDRLERIERLLRDGSGRDSA